jgi:hypothetical protein
MNLLGSLKAEWGSPHADRQASTHIMWTGKWRRRGLDGRSCLMAALGWMREECTMARVVWWLFWGGTVQQRRGIMGKQGRAAKPLPSYFACFLGKLGLVWAFANRALVLWEMG